MKILVYSPRFDDLIIKEQIKLGTENSCYYYNHKGGIARILNGEYSSIIPSLIDVINITTKKSIILLGSDKKTTITERIPSVSLKETNNNNYKVVLFSYAEDINWSDSYFKNFSSTTVLVDLSGRYKKFNQILKLLETVNRDFMEIIIFLTEHDPMHKKICQEVKKLNIKIIFHTPQEIVYYGKNKIIKVENKYYKYFERDFVGYGDYIALLTCQQLSKNLPLNNNFFETCQELIRMNIDEQI